MFLALALFNRIFIPILFFQWRIIQDAASEDCYLGSEGMRCNLENGASIGLSNVNSTAEQWIDQIYPAAADIVAGILHRNSVCLFDPVDEPKLWIYQVG